MVMRFDAPPISSRLWLRRVAMRVSLVLVCATVCAGIQAQEARVEDEPPRRAAPVRASANASAAKSHGARPTSNFKNVVSVVHRIGGWRLLTLLERRNLQAADDDASRFVHTNIVAGYALGDNRHIIARLPQAEIEVVANNMPSAVAGEAGERIALTVVGIDGAERPVRFIGLDAATGLSLLEEAEANSGSEIRPGSERPRPTFSYDRRTPPPPPSPAASSATPHAFVITSSSPSSPPVGTQMILFAPGAAKARAKTNAVLLKLNRTPAELIGSVTSAEQSTSRFIARFATPSVSLTGAVATDRAGAFVGIVERVGDDGARVIPRGEVERAAARLLANRRSVSQPWLGAGGQTLAGVKLEELLAEGWQATEARRLLASKRGVLLTSVPPYTPAALADLRSGDVITRVGEQPVRGVEDFSRLIAEAGSNGATRLTVERAANAPREIVVELSESFDPAEETARASRLARLAEVGVSIGTLLQPLGLEIVTAPANLRARLGAEEGLLVVSLRRNGVAAASGLRPGDIIERANNELLTETNAAAILATAQRTEVTFDVLRSGQRIKITLNYPKDARTTNK